MASAKLVGAFLLCMMLSAPIFNVEALECSTVVNDLSPCIDYLKNGGKPSKSCCDGTGALHGAIHTPADGQTACQCMKLAARSVGGVNPTYAAALPVLCHVNNPCQLR